ncbi:hypothetical protein HII31_12579 [Pseudocercospora fuligena]|uniref:P-loop containing nucleoside triphosphate hydrolase protein n=1 Tax=Pseudocercospora fuligena TaxID=685502 RepID=A0A8H6R918_9PEZI|nr:hypothetical protein HII31_12579 [Pseudocercospora fuligena]
MGLAEESNCPFIRPKTTWMNKRNKTRIIPMKLLCFGLGRTGTASLRMALWELGFANPWHGFSVFENPPDAQLCNEAMIAKFENRGQSQWTKKDWDALFFDNDAILDQPSAMFVEELITAYPDAKILITVRDTDTWYESIQATILGPANVAAKLLGYLDPTCGLIFSELERSNVWSYGKNYSNTTREEAQEIWDEHLEKVRRMAPKGEMLEFDVKEGWEPLCRFLGCEVPRDEGGKVKPFPRVNDTAAFENVIGAYFKKLLLKRIAQVGAVLIATVSIGVAIWRNLR